MKFWRKSCCYYSKSGAWYYLAPEQISFWEWLKDLFVKPKHKHKMCSNHESSEQLELEIVKDLNNNAA